MSVDSTPALDKLYGTLHRQDDSVKVTIQNTDFSEHALQHFEDWPPLTRCETLHLKGCSWKHYSRETFGAFLLHMFPNLVTLNAGKCEVDPDSLELLCNLTQHPLLVHVYLGDNRISTKGILTIVRSKGFHRLQSLGLAGNDIGDEGVGILAGALMGSCLIKLDLGNNQISATGVASLCPFISNADSKLETLSLVSNPIGDSGLERLARALDGNSTIGSLYLNSTGITAASCSNLVEVLRSATHLELLAIGRNKGHRE